MPADRPPAFPRGSRQPEARCREPTGDGACSPPGGDPGRQASYPTGSRALSSVRSGTGLGGDQACGLDTFWGRFWIAGSFRVGGGARRGRGPARATTHTRRRAPARCCRRCRARARARARHEPRRPTEQPSRLLHAPSSRRCQAPAASERRSRSEATSAPAGTGRCRRRCRGTAFPLGAMSAEAAQARARHAAGEQLGGRLPQGARHHGAPGPAAAHEHGHRRSVRPRSLLRLGLRHARRSCLGLAAGRARSFSRRHFTVVGNTVVAEPFFLGAWPTLAGTAFSYGRPGASPRCPERRTPRGRSCSRSTARSGRRVVFSSESLTDHLAQNAVRVSPLDRVGVLTGDLPSGAQKRVDEIVRTSTSPTTRRRSSARRSSGSNGRDSTERASAGPAARARGSLTTTGCKARRSSSSSTTRGTTARTSTASGAISSATQGAICSSRRVQSLQANDPNRGLIFVQYPGIPKVGATGLVPATSGVTVPRHGSSRVLAGLR